MWRPTAPVGAPFQLPSAGKRDKMQRGLVSYHGHKLRRGQNKDLIPCFSRSKAQNLAYQADGTRFAIKDSAFYHIMTNQGCRERIVWTRPWDMEVFHQIAPPSSPLCCGEVRRGRWESMKPEHGLQKAWFSTSAVGLEQDGCSSGFGNNEQLLIWGRTLSDRKSVV